MHGPAPTPWDAIHRRARHQACRRAWHPHIKAGIDGAENDALVVDPFDHQFPVRAAFTATPTKSLDPLAPARRNCGWKRAKNPYAYPKTIAKGKLLTLEARGGAGIPRYQVLGANADAVAVTVSTQDLGQLVVIVAGKEAVDANVAPTLVFTDGHGKRRVSVKLVVTK